MIDIVKKEDNTFTFSLKTKNNVVLLHGNSFNTKEELNSAIKEIMPSINSLNVFERKTAYNGKFLFNLKTLNGKVIGKSQFYSSEAGMENGIKNLKNSFLSINNLQTL
ncbi:YegP family protein [Cellulophaga omnivescoria]|uniref:YegP family protein n=1 Tax=Cellulophaga omnivescoria TaxID=1888890 RepID=UPI0009840BBF|nr:YegP family protein [Cellulophaga omnivescoria]WBU88893.1 YegP family protein [Cellulophaga omnivescoria]WKB80865.1 YegP family protein [Cellulophaga lytica]